MCASVPARAACVSVRAPVRGACGAAPARRCLLWGGGQPRRGLSAPTPPLPAPLPTRRGGARPSAPLRAGSPAGRRADAAGAQGKKWRGEAERYLRRPRSLAWKPARREAGGRRRHRPAGPAGGSPAPAPNATAPPEPPRELLN